MPLDPLQTAPKNAGAAHQSCCCTASTAQAWSSGLYSPYGQASMHRCMLQGSVLPHIVCCINSCYFSQAGVLKHITKGPGEHITKGSVCCCPCRLLLPLLEQAQVPTWAVDLIGGGFTDSGAAQRPDMQLGPQQKREHLFSFWQAKVLTSSSVCQHPAV